MLFPFRLLVLHSSVWFFSFSSSVSCWSLILSLYQIPIGMLCSFFSRCHLMLSSKTVIVKWIFIWMLFFHEMYILYYTFGSTAAIWQAKQKLLHTNETWNGWRKKMLQMMWIWFVVCFGSHCKNIFLSLRLWALGGFLAFSLQANTHNIFWYKTESNIINVVWNFWIYTPNARDFHHSVSVCMCIFCRYFCLLAPISFFSSSSSRRYMEMFGMFSLAIMVYVRVIW